MNDPLLSKHRETILQAASRHGASNVRVFGSRAKGAGVRGSDLDLLISLEEGRTLLDLVRLKRELEQLTHREVDLVTEKALSPYMRREILADAVRL